MTVKPADITVCMQMSLVHNSAAHIYSRFSKKIFYHLVFNFAVILTCSKTMETISPILVKHVL